MSRVQDTMALKRKRGDQSLLTQSLGDADHNVLNIIKGKEGRGISSGELKKVSNLPTTQFNKSIKTLVARQLIKEVPNIKTSWGKHYMGAEFEPSAELTGGYWYADGKLDQELINSFKKICFQILQQKLKVATAEGVHSFFIKRKLYNGEISRDQIAEILRSMVLDNQIVEVKSTGLEEYHSIPVGEVCYRCATGGGLGETSKTKTGAMVSIPCGVCPNIRLCTPDGVISPTNCVYYTKWLDF
ncbi:DNA-directed RNA polymerase III subunit RPC6 [Heracleum sosnowskyi]|uniref:DNA-directed RNA polymerase III subunit RPC6 n=1 Tax=Heracleum sosnowskyi TaxID=360622 RepID=A0AAD8JG56_9APIA|nr:DNA-directed RNA polymerase III subunit RPC6 [Heracleum sosnowskyi]